jgi:hypothetical protein
MKYEQIRKYCEAAVIADGCAESELPRVYAGTVSRFTEAELDHIETTLAMAVPTDLYDWFVNMRHGGDALVDVFIDEVEANI